MPKTSLLRRIGERSLVLIGLPQVVIESGSMGQGFQGVSSIVTVHGL